MVIIYFVRPSMIIGYYGNTNDLSCPVYLCLTINIFWIIMVAIQSSHHDMKNKKVGQTNVLLGIIRARLTRWEKHSTSGSKWDRESESKRWISRLTSTEKYGRHFSQTIAEMYSMCIGKMNWLRMARKTALPFTHTQSNWYTFSQSLIH